MKNPHRIFSRSWWHYRPDQEAEHPIRHVDLGTFMRLRLEQLYGVDVRKWPNHVDVQLRRTTANNVQDHRSYHEYIGWLEREGFEVVMAQNSLTEGRNVRLKRMAPTPREYAQQEYEAAVAARRIRKAMVQNTVPVHGKWHTTNMPPLSERELAEIDDAHNRLNRGF